MGWGGHGLEGSSRATGVAGLYGRANLTLWVVGGSRDTAWLGQWGGLGGFQGVEHHVSVDIVVRCEC